MTREPTPRERLAARVRALRAKTVQNGCTEGEALAAAAKVAQLLADHGMTEDEAELRASPFDQQTHAEPDDVGARLWKPAQAIAALTGTRMWTSGPGVNPAEHTFFGFDHEVEIAGYLLDICATAMRGGRAQVLRDSALLRPARQRMRLMPFLDGMADRLGERILALRPPRPTGSGLVVLRGALIEAAMRAAGIEVVTTHRRTSRDTETDYRRGRDAADRVALNRGVAGDRAPIARLT